MFSRKPRFFQPWQNGKYVKEKNRTLSREPDVVSLTLFSTAEFRANKPTSSLDNRVPTLLLKKIQDFSRTSGEIFQDLYGAHKCLHIRKNGEKHLLTLFKVWEWGNGVPLPSRLGGLGERC